MHRLIAAFARLADHDACWMGMRHLRPAPGQRISPRLAWTLALMVGGISAAASMLVNTLLLILLAAVRPDLSVSFDVLPLLATAAGILGGLLQALGAWSWNRRIAAEQSTSS